MAGNMNVDHNNVPCHWCATNKNLIQQLGLPPCNKQQVKPADCNNCTCEKSRSGRNFQCHENPGSAFPGNPFRSKKGRKKPAIQANSQPIVQAGNQPGLTYNQPFLNSASIPTIATATFLGTGNNLFFFGAQPQPPQVTPQVPTPPPGSDQRIAALQAELRQVRQQLDALHGQQPRRGEQDEEEPERSRHLQESAQSPSPNVDRGRLPSSYNRLPEHGRRSRELLSSRRHSPSPGRQIMSLEASFERDRRRSPEQYRRPLPPADRQNSLSQQPPDNQSASARNRPLQDLQPPSPGSRFVGHMPHEFPPESVERAEVVANRGLDRRSSMMSGLSQQGTELRRDDQRSNNTPARRERASERHHSYPLYRSVSRSRGRNDRR